MTWGIPIALYLFLAGASAGSFAFALLLNARAHDGRVRPSIATGESSTAQGESSTAQGEPSAAQAQPSTAVAQKVGFIAAPLLLAFGVVFLIVDAQGGLSHPAAFFGVFLNFGSVMTWGAYFILLTFIAEVVSLWLFVSGKARENGLPGALIAVGLILSFALAAYTAVLLGVVGPSPLWNSAALVILFAISAALSGASLVVLVQFALDREGASSLIESLTVPALVIEVVEAVVLAAHVFLVAANGAAGAASATSLVSGSYAVAFWLGLVVVGIALPLVVNAFGARKAGSIVGGQVASGLGAAANAQGAGAATAVPVSSALGALSVHVIALAGTVVGALVLRIVIIGAAQLTYVSVF